MNQERRLHTPSRPRRPGSGSGPTARRRAVRASEPTLADIVRLPEDDDFDEVAHNTAVLLAQCGGVENALQLEWLISRFLPCWGDRPAGINTDYVVSTTLAIIDELESNGESAALLALRGLEAVAGGTIAQQSGNAAARLAASGVAAPPWAWQIGQAEPVDARVTRNDEDNSVGVLVEYAYPDDDRHTLAVFIAGYMGGAVKFVGLMTGLAEARGGDELRFELVPPAHAQRRIREALEATDQAHAHFDGDPSMREFAALAWARVRDA